MRGRRHRGIADTRARRDRRHCRMRRAPPASGVLPGHGVVGTTGRQRHHRPARRAARPGRRTGPDRATAIACDLLLMSGGWTPERATVLPGPRQAALGCRRWTPSCPARFREAQERAGACNGIFDLAAAFAEGAAAGQRRRAGAGGDRSATAPARDPRRIAAGAVAAEEGLRGFPERRHRRGPRPGGARGLPLDRACEALHHQRHGDRPGQDQRHDGPRHHRRRAGARRAGGRADHLPPALHARHLRHPRRRHRAARCSTRSAPRRCTTGRWPGARCSSTVGQWQRARAFPQPGEDCTPRSPANAARCGRRSASSMPRPWARSRWSGRMPPSSWTASMSTAGRNCGPAAAATAAAARGRLHSAMMAWSPGWRTTDSMSPPPPAARPACCTCWRTTCQTELPELRRLADLRHRALGA